MVKGSAERGEEKVRVEGLFLSVRLGIANKSRSSRLHSGREHELSVNF